MNFIYSQYNKQDSFMTKQANKRKRRDDDEDVPVTAIYDERIDMNHFEHIAKLVLRILDADYTIKSMKKKLVGKSANRVKYRPSKKFLDGRVYGNGGLSGLPKWIVNIVAGSYYHDV
jgi:hypothetical protein